MEYLKVFELLLHGRENELLKFFFADFPAARTAFVFRPFGTAEIAGASLVHGWLSEHTHNARI